MAKAGPPLAPGGPNTTSSAEHWPADPGKFLELRDGTLIWPMSFTAGAKIALVNGRSYWAFGGAEDMPNGVMAAIRSTVHTIRGGYTRTVGAPVPGV